MKTIKGIYYPKKDVLTEKTKDHEGLTITIDSLKKSGFSNDSKEIKALLDLIENLKK
jgi:hypothetical protein